MHLHLLLNRCLCDYRCLFCTMGSADFVADQKRILSDFDYDEEWQRIDSAVRAGAEDPAIDALHIMGNDPCNHPHLTRAVELARELDYGRVTLESIGIALEDPAFAARVVEAGVSHFKIPVYGCSAEVHDAIVRLPGAFDRVMQVIDNLAALPVRVELHALLLKQNLSDLRPDGLRLPLRFRFPFEHDNADFPYAYYAPRLRDVPPRLLDHCDLVIPCVNGKHAEGERSAEARVRPEASEERDEDSNFKTRRPSKCSPESCSAFDRCHGIYGDYLALYGEDEFDPANVIALPADDDPPGSSRSEGQRGPHGLRGWLQSIFDRYGG